MENFLKRVLTMEADQWTSEVIDTKVYEDPDGTYRIYEVTTKLTFDDDRDPVIQTHQIAVPLSVSGVVNNAKFNRVSITSAQERWAIKVFKQAIKIPGLYIDTAGDSRNEPSVSIWYGKTIIPYYSFLMYYGLLQEFEPEVDPATILPLDDKQKAELDSFEINERSVTKMRLLYKIQEPIPNKLTAEFVAALIRLINDEERCNTRTPLDFVYYDTVGGLIKELNQTDNFFGYRRQMMYHANKNGMLYVTPIQSTIDRYFRMQSSSIRNIQSSQDTNALSIAVQSKKIFFYGTEKGEDYDKLRLYNNYFIGVLDPEKTHDGPNINTDNDLTLNTSIENGEIYVVLYNKKFEEVRVKYSDYCISKVLVENQVDVKNKRIIPNNGVYVYFQFGEYSQTTDPAELDYYRPVKNCLSPATALVPFINKSDATRAMLGAHMIGQAIPVVGAQPGIVSTFENKQLYESSGLNIYSADNGKVIDILDDKYVKIETEEGGEKIIESPGWIKSKASTTNKFVPNVKVGDAIKKGDPIFTINSFKDKEFAIGVPLYTAFTTYFGHDHEDGIILTESGAAKLAHPMMETKVYEFPGNATYQMTNLGLIEGGEVDISRYSDFGIIKPGVGIRGEEPLIDFYTYSDPYSKEGKLKELLQIRDSALEHTTLRVPAQINNGIVKDVRVIVNEGNVSGNEEFIKYYKKEAEEKNRKIDSFFGSNRSKSSIDSSLSFVVEIDIEYFNTIRPGTLSNKITNKFGSKGVVTYIIPDEIAPQDQNGNKIECIMSPLSTFSRKNPSQMYETKLGLVGKAGYEYVQKLMKENKYDEIREFLTQAYDNTDNAYWTDDEIRKTMKKFEKYGYLRFIVSPFDEFYTVDRLNKLIDMVGYGDGRVQIFFPEVHKWTRNPVTVGYSEIIRLSFIPENKAKTTSMINIGNYLPFGLGDIKGEGQKWSNQEVWAMLSHGKLKELTQIINESENKTPELFSALLTLGMSLD